MSDVISAATELQNDPDFGKQVYYTPGMVVRAVDFTRTRRYPVEKLTQHNSGLHGYGTVHGLLVTPTVDKNPQSNLPDVKIAVGAGMGIDRAGFAFTIEETQCAYLGDWLDKHQPDVDRTKSSEGGIIYVLARYMSIYTDSLALADQSCWNGTETSAPSRVQDSFELQLTLDKPSLPLWEVSLRFRGLISGIVVGDQDEAEKLWPLVRGLDPSLPLESLPSQLSVKGSLDAIFEAANLIWTGEVLPKVVTADKAATSYPSILLAAIHYRIDGGRPTIVRTEGLARFDERPYLLHTQVFQHMPWNQKAKDVVIGQGPILYEVPGGEVIGRPREVLGGEEISRIRDAKSLLVAAPAVTSDALPIIPTPLVTITPLTQPEALTQASFELWFHLDQFPNAAPDAYLDETKLDITVWAELTQPQQRRVSVTVTNGTRLESGINTISITPTFDVDLSNVRNFIFVIPLAGLQMKNTLKAKKTTPLMKSATSRYFEGQTSNSDGNAVVVTYVRNTLSLP